MMSIRLPEACLRDRIDCVPISQIASDGGVSFICCGLSRPDSRTVKQDKFRVCWKNKTTDSTFDYDERDMKDTMSVLAQALSVDANMKENDLSEIL